MRLENTWQEIRDHSFIQNHSRPLDFKLHNGVSSLQFTSLIFYKVQKLGFVPSDPFLGCFWSLCLDYCTVGRSNMAYYNISNRVSHLLFFYLLVFDGIHDAMCLNNMSRNSSRNIYAHNIKNTAVYFHCTHGVLLILSVYCYQIMQNTLLHLAIKASPFWSSSCVWQLNMLEIVFWWFVFFVFFIYLLKPSQTTCGDVSAVW